MTNRWRGWHAAALAAVLATLLPLTTLLVAVWLLGWQLLSVQSGSMSPTFAVGSLLVVGQLDPADVAPGMAITFEDPAASGKLVTHRVVGAAPGEQLAFITRGDANATPDPRPIPARLVRGRVLWSITALGAALDWLQWPRSFVLLVLLPGALLARSEWRARRPGGRDAPTAGQTGATAPWPLEDTPEEARS